VKLEQPQSTDQPTRVLLLSSKDIFADGLEVMLSNMNSVESFVYRELDHSCLDQLGSGPVDILLINTKALHYPLDGFLNRFTEVKPDLKILVFGHDEDPVFVRNLIRAGAKGFLNDETGEKELGAAIQEVMAGYLWVKRSLLDQIAIDAFELEKIIENSIMERLGLLDGQLTPRESDIFRLVLEGMSTKEIADHLHLSQQSIKLYLKRLFDKFEVSNRSQLILSAFERICPIQNMVMLFRKTLDRKRVARGEQPLISDPLEE